MTRRTDSGMQPVALVISAVLLLLSFSWATAQIVTVNSQDESLTREVRRLVEAGSFAQAVDVANRIGQLRVRDVALEELVFAFVETEQVERALHVVGMISELALRQSLLTYVTTAARSGSPSASSNVEPRQGIRLATPVEYHGYCSVETIVTSASARGSNQQRQRFRKRYVSAVFPVSPQPFPDLRSLPAIQQFVQAVVGSAIESCTSGRQGSSHSSQGIGDARRSDTLVSPVHIPTRRCWLFDSRTAARRSAEQEQEVGTPGEPITCEIGRRAILDGTPSLTVNVRNLAP